MAELTYYKFRRSQIAELADWQEGCDMEGVSISQADKDAGSPKAGDKIARNPSNHADRWLVAGDYFTANFEALRAAAPASGEAEKALDLFPEINLGNYNHENVEALNEWGIEAYDLLCTLSAENAELKARLAAPDYLAPEPDPKAHRRCKCEFSGGGVLSKKCAFHAGLAQSDAPVEIIGQYTATNGKREWWAGGTWLRPGECIAVLPAVPKDPANG